MNTALSHHLNAQQIYTAALLVRAAFPLLQPVLAEIHAAERAGLFHIRALRPHTLAQLQTATPEQLAARANVIAREGAGFEGERTEITRLLNEGVRVLHG